MKKPIDTGMNRTGIGMSPMDSKATIEGAREAVSNPSYDLSGYVAIRDAYSKEAEPVGTVPPPPSVKGMAQTAMQALKGNKPTVFIDMLGERLAFERSGVRLYEALLSKFDAAHVHEGGPTREQIQHIHDEELKHFGMLMQAMEQLGADPTAVTPSADVTGVASMGVLQVLTDPRSTLTEALHAIHMVELLDNDAWQMMADLAEQLGQDDLAAQFREAKREEDEHLELVRTWLTNTLMGQAGIARTPGQTTH